MEDPVGLGTFHRCLRASALVSGTLPLGRSSLGSSRAAPPAQSILELIGFCSFEAICSLWGR